jgi:glycosyltransferase involved in cell wall biosynthesis
MPSVIILSKTLLKGGAEKQALILSKLLTENGIHTVVVNWCGEYIDEAHNEFIKRNSIQYIGLKGNLISKFFAFRRILKAEKSDILLSYLTLANFITGLSKLTSSKLRTIGGIRTDNLPLHKFIFERFVHNHLNDVTVFNNYSANGKFIARGFNPDKILVIHNAINVPALEKKNQTDTVINVVTVARFVGPKDFASSLKSFKRLVEKNPAKKFKYFIAGYGPLENEIRQLVEQLHLENEVVILINPPDIPGLLRSSDIYLSTSLFEGLSNSIMEAMVAGLPVIATDVGDNKYLVKENFNGFLAPCFDVDLLAEKLDVLAGSEELRREFGNNSYKMIQNEFSEEKLFQNYTRLFSKLLFSESKK